MTKPIDTSAHISAQGAHLAEAKAKGLGGFESAMCCMGVLIGAMATHETDDGKRVYNNEHIKWMFEQWQRAQ